MYKCKNCGLCFQPYEGQTTCPSCKALIERSNAFMDMFEDILKGDVK